MATRDDLFSSRFFKGETFKAPRILEIEMANTELLKDSAGVAKEKLVLSFRNEKHCLVVNATNFDTIVEVTGEPDSEMWPGHKICLLPSTTTLGNRRVPCIRVKAPVAPKAVQPKAPPPSSIDALGSPAISDAELEQMMRETDDRGDETEL